MSVAPNLAGNRKMVDSWKRESIVDYANPRMIYLLIVCPTIFRSKWHCSKNKKATIASMNKIEIEGPYETLERISIFLENNHIKHNVIGDLGYGQAPAEIQESIDWPI